MWPMVPTLTWGLFRSNFSLAMVAPTFLSGDQTDGVDGDLLASDPSDDLVGDRLRDLLVRVELHRVRGAALCARTQVGSVTEHVREGHLSSDHHAVAPLLVALPPPTTGVEVTEHIAHVVLGRDALDRHDRLQQHRRRSASRFLER